jgi:hypothetical protein
MTTIEKPGRPPQAELWFENDYWKKEWAKLTKKHGGYDPATGTFTAIKKAKLLAKTDVSGWFIADSLCAAYEEGLLTEETLPEAFETPADFEFFIDFLYESRDVWMNERHHSAFMELGINEDDAAGYELVSDYLRDHVLEETD